MNQTKEDLLGMRTNCLPVHHCVLFLAECKQDSGHLRCVVIVDSSLRVCALISGLEEGSVCVHTASPKTCRLQNILNECGCLNCYPLRAFDNMLL